MFQFSTLLSLKKTIREFHLQDIIILTGTFLCFRLFLGNAFVFFMFQGKPTIDHDTGNQVIIVLFCVAALATFLMLFLQKPEHEGQKRDEASLWASRVSFIAEAGPKEAFIKSLKLAIKPRILMLCPLFCYFGEYFYK